MAGPGSLVDDPPSIPVARPAVTPNSNGRRRKAEPRHVSRSVGPGARPWTGTAAQVGASLAAQQRPFWENLGREATARLAAGDIWALPDAVEAARMLGLKISPRLATIAASMTRGRP
jgi:hypothetical protein